MTQKRTVIDTEKCIGCGLCGKVCAAHNLEIKNKKAAAIIDSGKKVAMTLVLGYPDVKFLRSTPHKKLNVRDM